MPVEPEDLNACKPDCLTGAAIEEKAETVAIGKVKTEAPRCFALAVMAGMFVSLGAIFMIIVRSDSSLGFAGQQVLGGICFSLGLICVVVAGAELFTGNSLMICATASGKINVGALLKNWLIVYLGNLTGSLLMVFLVFAAGTSSLNGGEVGNTMITLATSKIDLEWYTIFARGILCNVLVCIAVWMGFAGRTVIDKIFTCMWPVMAFCACGFEHCVANMFILPMGLLTKASGFAYTGTANIDVLNMGGILFNISAATLGNIVGGALLIGFMYWLAYHRKQTKKQEIQ